MAPTIERAQLDDLARVLSLLERHGLPLDGASELAEAMVVARDDGRLVGAAVLELYAGGRCLRSVAVDASVRGKGIVEQSTAAALVLASELGVPMVFLRTTTAAELFPRFGFERITREDVPPSVTASVEFQSACPASAVVMRSMGNPS